MIQRNLAANFVGIGWSGVLMVAMVPVYVRLLGLEAYGVIAFYTAVQAVVVLLDFGLATAVNREVARLSVSRANADRMRVLVSTAEIAFWAGGLALSAGLFLAAPAIATRWLTLRDLPAADAVTALRLMAIALGVRWPYNLYASTLLGLQRHVALNALLVGGATARFGGGVALLLLIAPDVRIVFAWEIVAAALQTFAAAAVVRGRLPAAVRSFDASVLSHTWVFARGTATIGLLAAVATQIDKFAVSRLLPLETFGRYGIAVTIASVVVMAVSPVHTTVFPRFSQLVAGAGMRELAIAYHRAAQTVSAIILPAALMAILFGQELVALWTGNAALGREIQPLVVLLVAAALLNGLLTIPYVLQLAHGWTSPAIWMNGVAVVVMIPLTIAGVRAYGAPGAALAALLMHALQLFAGVVFTHRRLLPGELFRWAWQDVVPPALAALIICAAARMLIAPQDRFLAAKIVATAALAFAASALTTPVVREWIHEWQLRAKAAKR